MAVQFSTAYRNAALDAFETTVGTAARLLILTGTQPADCATADSGTTLADMTLPSDWLAAASGGSKALSGSWSDASANATGTAGYFRIKDNGATTTHLQGSVTATGGGGDMTLATTSITSGTTVTITSFTLSIGGA